MIERKQKYNLLIIIYRDFQLYGKTQLFLLLLVLVTAISTIMITHQMRIMITIREDLLLKKDTLDTEWRHLMLQEKILSDHDRIEHIATEKLQMLYVEPALEGIFN